MSTAFDPYRDWLGIADSGGPPDHYRLLGLKPFSSDTAAIERALSARLAAVRRIQPGKHLSQWEQLLADVSAAGRCLLDPSEKASYDRQLRGGAKGTASPGDTYIEVAPADPNLFPPVAPRRTSTPSSPAGEQMPSSPTREQTPASAREQSPEGESTTATPGAASPILPDGDPMAPVDIDLPFAAEAQASVSNAPKSSTPDQDERDPADAEWDELMAAEWDAPKPADERPLIETKDSAAVREPNPVAAPIALAPESGSPQRRPLWADRYVVVGALLALGLAGAGLVWAVLDNSALKLTAKAEPDDASQQVPIRDGDDAKRSGNTPGTKPATPNVPPPKDPGHPMPTKVPSPAPPVVSTGEDTQKVPPEKNPPAPDIEKPEQTENGGSDGGDTPKTSPPKPPTKSPPKTSPPKPPTKSLPIPSPPETPTPPTPTVQPPSPPSGDRSAELNKSLVNLRAALGSRNMARAKQELAKAESLAQSAEEKSRVETLRLLNGYVEGFWDAVRKALAELKPAEELKIGSTIVSVVQVSSDAITIHMTGANRDYTVATMPAGLAMTLAQQWFDANASSTKVYLGAFHAVDPRGDRRVARRLWQEATLSGAEVDDLLPLLDESTGVLADELSAPPDEAATRAARATMRKTWGLELAAAKSPSRKLELAAKLIEHAGGTAEPIDRWVLLQTAADLAAQGANPALLFRSVDEMAKVYQVDAMALKASGLDAAVRAASQPSSAKTVARSVLKLLDDAVAAKRADLVERLLELSVSAARRAQDPSLLKQALKRQEQLKST